MSEKRKFRMPWDEKTIPGPAPERVEIPTPWNESVGEMTRTPPTPTPRKPKKPAR